MAVENLFSGRTPMSIEAINWALTKAPIPRDRRDASSLAAVLVGLANHASPDGTNAFPSVGTLTQYTRLSERSVQNALRALEELGLIRPGDPDIVAAHVKRADRRPRGWDLAIHSGVQSVRPVSSHGVQTQHRGVQTTTSRGAVAAPEPSLNRPGNHRAPPVCGTCDARPNDPISARIVWLDPGRTRSARCPRCHPRAGPPAESRSA